MYLEDNRNEGGEKKNEAKKQCEVLTRNIKNITMKERSLPEKIIYKFPHILRFHFPPLVLLLPPGTPSCLAHLLQGIKNCFADTVCGNGSARWH